jgi:hypothetical protein
MRVFMAGGIELQGGIGLQGRAWENAKECAGVAKKIASRKHESRADWRASRTSSREGPGRILMGRARRGADKAEKTGGREALARMTHGA